MVNTIIISVLKILDNFLLTTKTILVQKNKALFAALTVTLSQFMFYFVISKVIEQNSMYINLYVSIASGIGSYFAMKVNDKLSKEKMYFNTITYKNKEDVIELCEFLKQNKVKYIVTDGYNRDWTTSMVVQIFAQTKNESKLIDKFIDDKNKKYLREVIK